VLDYDYKSRGRFHVFTTTKKLLRITTMITTHVCCNATYNIVIQGFPILMSGTTDKDHQFHPLCLVIWRVFLTTSPKMGSLLKLKILPLMRLFSKN